MSQLCDHPSIINVKEKGSMEKKKFFRDLIESIVDINSVVRNSEYIFSDSELKELECVCSALAMTCRTTSFINSLCLKDEK